MPTLGETLSDSTDLSALVPDASATVRGLVSPGAQSFLGPWTLSGALTVSGNLVAQGTVTAVTDLVTVKDFRVQGSPGTFTGTGVGLEMFAAAGTSFYTSFNRTTVAYAPLHIAGTSVLFSHNGGAALMSFVDGKLGIQEPSPGASLQINTGGASVKGLIVKGAASQSANITENQLSDGTVIYSQHPAGGATVNTAGGGSTSASHHFNIVNAVSVTDWRQYDGSTTCAIQMLSSATEGFVLVPTLSAGTPRTQLITSGGFELKVGATVGTNSGSSAMFVASDGKVGIGTTDPGSVVDIQASGVADLLEITRGDAGGAYMTWRSVGTIRGYLGFDTAAGGGIASGSLGNSTVLRSENALHLIANASAASGGITLIGGKVGIGTTDPFAPFSIESAEAGGLVSTHIKFGGAYFDSQWSETSRWACGMYSDAGGLRYGTANGNAVGVLTLGSGWLRFANGVSTGEGVGASITERLVIDPAGLVGINQLSSLTAQFQVTTSGAAVKALILKGAASQSAAYIEVNTLSGGGGDVLLLAANGNFTASGVLIADGYIGTTTINNSMVLRGNGTGALLLNYASGSGGVAIYNGSTTLRWIFQTTGLLEASEGSDIAFGTTTGSKLATAANQKLGIWGATPVVQPTTIADADGNLADITTKFNALLAKLETIGLLAAA